MDKFLIVSDLHLTDKPIDEYRWKVFPWLVRLSKKYEPKYIFILGDLTHEKDRHSGRLVNRIICELRNLSYTGAQVSILKGNHDYVDEELPFFDFLRGGTLAAQVYFTGTAGILDLHGDSYQYLFLPHTRTPEEDWKRWKGTEVDFIFCHQFFSGAKLGNQLDTIGMGTPRSIFKDLDIKGQVVSGDIHVPQKLGNVLYCGAPHPIIFSDQYEPRVLRWTGKNFQSIPRPEPYVKRHLLKITSLKAFEEWETDPGDQVKIDLTLGLEDAALWEEQKTHMEKIAEAKGVTICSFKVSLYRKDRKITADQAAMKGVRRFSQDPTEVLRSFCTDFGHDGLVQYTGEYLIKGE